jgi:hypothetical protein
MIWIFFTFGHWKGEVDGARTLCKWEICKEQVKLKLQNAHEVVLYLKAKANKHHASHNNVRRIVNKVFWEIKISDINSSRCYNCNTVNGSVGG